MIWIEGTAPGRAWPTPQNQELSQMTDEKKDGKSSRSETDEERAERIAREVGRENPDPMTRREAIEQELAEEDLSEEGGELGQHNE